MTRRDRPGQELHTLVHDRASAGADRRRLSEWFVGPPAGGHPVALRFASHGVAARAVPVAEFVADVARLRARLGDEPPGGFLLLTEDAYAFAVGLCGLWTSGRHAISPPNEQPGTLAELKSRAAGVVSDRGELFAAGSAIDPLAADTPHGDAPLFEVMDREAAAVEFFTSGTTGDAKSILKSIRHLEDEVAELGLSWDDLASGATVFASASHQHLYGVLFGVLGRSVPGILLLRDTISTLAN